MCAIENRGKELTDGGYDQVVVSKNILWSLVNLLRDNTASNVVSTLIIQ